MSEFLKMIVVMNVAAIKEMKGNRGRMITQAAHGYIHALWDAEKRFPDLVNAFKNQPSAFKITLSAENEEVLQTLRDYYKPICGVSLVEETGSRMNGQVNEDHRAITCLGIGPLLSSQTDSNIKSLKAFL